MSLAREKSPDWPSELVDLIHWTAQLQPGDLPQPPWHLGACVQVFDNAAWLRSLRLDIAEGPAGPRMRTRALIEDLIWLRYMLDWHQAGELAKAANPGRGSVL